MTVVCDASPLHYLILLGHQDVLPRLYGSVLATETVLAELRHPHAPPTVRAWAEAPPEWIVVHPNPPSPDSSLDALDPGERTAILLAERIKASFLLLDELAARQLAASRRLKVAGLLAVLCDAAKADLLDLPEALDALRNTNFRVSPSLLRSLYSSAGG